MSIDSESLKSSVLHHIKFSRGKTPQQATTEDWQFALSLALRDLAVEPWLQSRQKATENGGKRVYYLSMEFLVGRLLEDVAINLGLAGTVDSVMAELGQSYIEIAAHEPDAALGNGGLGRLAACFMDSLATLGVPAIGYGIRYEHGLFKQGFTDGRQVEDAETWLVPGNAWEFERRDRQCLIGFGGKVRQVDGRATWTPAESVRAIAYDTPVVGWQGQWVNTLRLWSAQPVNVFDLHRFNEGDYVGAATAELSARTISRVLYPDDTTEKGQELRLKQEYFFTAASIQDILRRFLHEGHALSSLPSHVAIQLNDTHPAIAGPELVRLLVDEQQMPIGNAIDLARRCLGYTNHTLLPEALERWPQGLFSSLLPRHLQIIEQIEQNVATEISGASSILENGSVKMGELAFLMAQKVNGVSALHTELVKKTVFADLHRAYPDRIINKTNGVTPRRWLYSCNPSLSTLITETIGDQWPGALQELSRLEPHIDDSAFLEAYAQAKQSNKVRFAHWLKREQGLIIDPAFMFDIQIKRIHEYKRQLMNILETIALWNAIHDKPNGNWVPRVKLFGGKAAPGYVMAKEIIRLINDVASTINSDPVTKQFLQVVFPENYNVSMAEKMIPAADLSEQISTAGKEASGTGNMKLGLNGAPTIGTLDGANVEIRKQVGADNFFLFGLTAEKVAHTQSTANHARKAIADSEALSRVLEQIGEGVFSRGDKTRYTVLLNNIQDHDYFLVASDFDSYFKVQREVDMVYHDPVAWMKMAALNTARLGWFSSDRTINEYVQEIWQAR
ncbi:MAG: glycogen/starch/alpha-glucan phosphorylase [Granulosicoccus sp.]|nr:glycogen/starch/alpha-glucan phosphorylase [Granulosicoccus sp.]